MSATRIIRSAVFQSTPTSAGRRNAKGISDIAAVNKFQSTPTSAGRRNFYTVDGIQRPSVFQSTPTSAGRRNTGQWGSGDEQEVSIHSDQRWPEKCRRLQLLALAESFNPLRPALAGEIESV